MMRRMRDFGRGYCTGDRTEAGTDQGSERAGRAEDETRGPESEKALEG